MAREEVDEELQKEVERRVRAVYNSIGYRGIPFLTCTEKHFGPLGRYMDSTKRVVTPELYKALSGCRTVDRDELLISMKSLDEVITLEERVQQTEYVTKGSSLQMMLVPMVMNGKESSSVKKRIASKLGSLTRKFNKGDIGASEYSVITDLLKSDRDEGLKQLRNSLDFDRLIVMPTLPEIPELYGLSDGRKVERIKRDVSGFNRGKLFIDTEKRLLSEEREDDSSEA